MKQKLTLLFLLPILMLYGFRSKSSNNDKKVIQAAKADISKYLGLIPKGQENSYGFSSQDNLQKCTVGKPYQMMVLTNDFYKKTFVPDINTCHEYVIQINEWRAPIVLNGKNRTLLTVVSDKNNYRVVDMGGAVLSNELQEKSGGKESGAACYILRIHPLTADFLVISKNTTVADANFIPMTSALMAMPRFLRVFAFRISAVSLKKLHKYLINK